MKNKHEVGIFNPFNREFPQVKLQENGKFHNPEDAYQIINYTLNLKGDNCLHAESQLEPGKKWAIYKQLYLICRHLDWRQNTLLSSNDRQELERVSSLLTKTLEFFQQEQSIPQEIIYTLQDSTSIPISSSRETRKPPVTGLPTKFGPTQHDGLGKYTWGRIDREGEILGSSEFYQKKSYELLNYILRLEGKDKLTAEVCLPEEDEKAIIARLHELMGHIHAGRQRERYNSKGAGESIQAALEQFQQDQLNNRRRMAQSSRHEPSKALVQPPVGEPVFLKSKGPIQKIVNEFNQLKAEKQDKKQAEGQLKYDDSHFNYRIDPATGYHIFTFKDAKLCEEFLKRITSGNPPLAKILKNPTSSMRDALQNIQQAGNSPDLGSSAATAPPLRR